MANVSRTKGHHMMKRFYVTQYELLTLLVYHLQHVERHPGALPRAIHTCPSNFSFESTTPYYFTFCEAILSTCMFCVFFSLPHMTNVLYESCVYIYTSVVRLSSYLLKDVPYNVVVVRLKIYNFFICFCIYFIRHRYYSPFDRFYVIYLYF